MRRVWYPGLASHPDYAVATRLMAGFGGVVTFELETDLAGAMRFTDACGIPYIAPSLGGVESLVEMPVLMSYWDQPAEERAQLRHHRHARALLLRHRGRRRPARRPPGLRASRSAPLARAGGRRRARERFSRARRRALSGRPPP